MLEEPWPCPPSWPFENLLLVRMPLLLPQLSLPYILIFVMCHVLCFQDQRFYELHIMINDYENLLQETNRLKEQNTEVLPVLLFPWLSFVMSENPHPGWFWALPPWVDNDGRTLSHPAM